ncbi:MAG TPA: hypothetical protein VFO52_10445 [Longimicrobiales bacterium]|nr:hypothetical protein [Longimicrobiales bacterium]
MSTAVWATLRPVVVVGLQLVLLLLVVHSFRLMPAAWNTLKLTAVGFVINALLPLRYRVPFFIALSATAVLQLVGFVSGAQLFTIGLLLIGICHLPLAWLTRAGLLLVAGLALAFARTGALALPVNQVVWPILGSMFMFRLIIYMYDIKHDRSLATWSGALSYFFLLPNPVFPFFPVVDYKTFRRSYYSEAAGRIYQTGIAWMVRGVVQLILYRFVYYYLTISPEEIQTSAQLTRFIVSNYGLYLRVSGTFHIIVGMLHLFGFNLPLSNNAYFLASSFTDYWRRVNIYWKDFMLKVFYYPSYFWLRKFGPTSALVLATVVVFFATTVLHSYQWFWLRGDWYMSPMDVAFWSVLAVLVIFNVVRESKKGRKRTLGATKWTLKESTGRMGQILLTFAVLSALWSLWSAPSLREWLGMWSVWNVGSPVTLKVGVVIAGALLLVLLGDYLRARTRPGQRISELQAQGRLGGSPYFVLATLAVLLVLGDARVRSRFDSTLLLVVEDLQHDRLNRADQGQLERGYYENLFSVEQSNPELARRLSQDNQNWVSLWRTDAVRETNDLRRLELLPSVEMLYKGKQFTTNRWGMRDRDRPQLPLPGTYRFAVLGASTTMGSGVSDDELYTLLAEDRFAAEAGRNVEFMNFAVESYNALEQVAVIDQRIGQFGPHGVLYIAHETEFEKTITSLSTLVETRTDLVYPELRAIVREAGVQPGMPRTIALRRLNAVRDKLVGWSYRHMAAQARAQGILPVWVFIPMPVPGTGPCPPGSAQLFCFGNLSRAGAAADASDPRVNTLFNLARDAGFVILDLSNVYGDADLLSLWIAKTDGHPNAEGHRMIADGFFKQLNGNITISQDFDKVTTRSVN